MLPSDCCFYIYCVNVHFHRKKNESENSVTLLGIEVEIDNKLNFEKHVTALRQKADRQLNTLLNAN